MVSIFTWQWGPATKWFPPFKSVCKLLAPAKVCALVWQATPKKPITGIGVKGKFPTQFYPHRSAMCVQAPDLWFTFWGSGCSVEQVTVNKFWDAALPFMRLFGLFVMKGIEGYWEQSGGRKLVDNSMRSLAEKCTQYKEYSLEIFV